jgi:pSer/pThr/pTyr-binding forkhead associated (FHA) protein
MNTMNPRLLVIAGPQSRGTFPVADERFSIGRAPQNHLSVPDPSVSREHCVLVRQGDGFIVRDLDSHNGTLVNDLPVYNQLLAHRDYITIGDTVLQFLTGDDVVFEDPAELATVSLSADTNSPPTAQLATADLHALLRVSTMLHSFHAMYRGRGSSARNRLERHLLSLILEVIPASRGAILLYEDSLDEPSSYSVKRSRSGTSSSRGDQPEDGEARVD